MQGKCVVADVMSWPGRPVPGQHKSVLSTFKVLVVLAALGAGLLQTGCATGAKASAMEVRRSDVVTASPAPTVGVIKVGEITGGKDTNPMWKSNVGTYDFRLALKNSLAAAGYLGDGNASYVLNAELLDVKQPVIGFDYTVGSRVHYVLRDAQDGREALNETIDAEYTAKAGDAFLGVKRLQLANEGSIRNNIKAFLQKLSQLQLNP